MTGELGVMGSNPTPSSTFVLLFLKIYLEDFNNVKVYILQKKIKKNKKKDLITGKIAFKLYGQILFIGKTYFIILPRKFIGNT